MREYCYLVSDDQWNRMTAEELIKDGHCPAWVLPSRPYLGRCLPLGTVGNNTEPEYVNSLLALVKVVLK